MIGYQVNILEEIDKVFVLFSLISVCSSVQKLSEFFASEEIELHQEPKTPTPTDTSNHGNIKSVVSTAISKFHKNEMWRQTPHLH